VCKVEKYIRCDWCGSEIYYDDDCHDEAYEVDGDIICEDCFDEHKSSCSKEADRYFEELSDREGW